MNRETVSLVANSRFTFSALVTAADIELARNAGNEIARTLDTVWIVESVSTRRMTGSVYSVVVKFVAPYGEATADDPAIVRAALNGCGLPVDSVVIR